MAIAPNDSQNPAELTAHGSINTTIKSATASTREIGTFLPSNSAAANTMSIKSVRCVGTESPAKQA